MTKWKISVTGKIPFEERLDGADLDKAIEMVTSELVVMNRWVAYFIVWVLERVDDWFPNIWNVIIYGPAP